MSAPRILQICPHDSMPFGALCARYEQAGQIIDAQVTTVFLGDPAGAPLPGAHYLGVQDLADTKALARQLRRVGTDAWDLLICHRYRAYLGALKARIGARRSIVLAHEYDLLQRWQRRLGRRLFGAAFEFAGVAPGVAQQLAEHTGHSIVLPNVLDADGDAELISRSAARDALAVPDDAAPVVGLVGRLHYKKRPHLALQAFELFAARHPDALLVVVGDGEDLRALQAQAGSQVQFVGLVEDAPRYFRGFDVLLHAAAAEPFGMVVLEAMYAGVPVVCRRGHGPEHILAELGCYADTDDPAGFAEALERALQRDPEQLLIDGARRASEHFSLPVLARALLNLLASG